MRANLGSRGFDVHVMEEDAGAAQVDVPLFQLVVLPSWIILGLLADDVCVMEGGSEIRNKK